MQPLYAITVAILSLVLPSVLSAPSAKATPARAVPSCLDLPSRVIDGVFDSLPGNFTLGVVISRRNRKSPTPSPRPLRIGTYNLASPVLGPVNSEGTGFQLINKIFSITLGPRASILTDIFGTEGVDFSQISTPGLQSVVFDTDTRRPPANFTATAACDNDNKVYLRLRGDKGQGDFAIDRVEENSQVFFRPPEFTGKALRVELRIRSLPYDVVLRIIGASQDPYPPDKRPQGV